MEVQNGPHYSKIGLGTVHGTSLPTSLGHLSTIPLTDDVICTWPLFIFTLIFERVWTENYSCEQEVRPTHEWTGERAYTRYAIAVLCRVPELGGVGVR